MEGSNEGEIPTNREVIGNRVDNDDDERARSWVNLCNLCVAATASIMSAWLQLTYSAITLHTTQIGMTPRDKARTRRCVIENIIQSERHCKYMLRLSPLAFASLLSVLKSNKKVKNYCHTSIEEQLTTFLLILSHNLKNRVVCFMLCRSGETISRYFHNILRSVITLEDEYVKQPNGEEVQSTILNSYRFFPYFKDCLGAIDGTHVRVKVSQIDAPRYRGRKDWPTHNVLASCEFDLKFTYVLAGWEGSASNSRVLQNTLTRDEPLLIPDGKFYLANVGFGLSNKILTPYGRTRYHLKEYSQRPPETPEELFNYRHSSLRNSIERAFGVMKKRFPIIASGTECQYSCATMTNIILACCVLHNYLLSIDGEDYNSLNKESGASASLITDSLVLDSTISANIPGLEFRKGQEMRDRIASEMWAAYCSNTQY